MSYRLAAQLVRDRAGATRLRADNSGVDQGRLKRLKEYLHASDVQALDVWLARRIAQELDHVANDLQVKAREASEDVTVLAKKPG